MDKRRLKSLIYNYEVRVAAVITDGVIRRDSRARVLNRAWKEVLKVDLDVTEQTQMWSFVKTFYRHCVAAAGRELDVQMRAEKVYSVLRGDVQMLEHQKNELVNDVEYRKKRQELMDNLASEANFFYCTAHKNPAQGHADYQDRIYYRRNGNLSPEEKKFVRSQRLLAVEDVVMGPVWLCTRRNCTHRLIPIGFESAVNGDYRVETMGSEISYEEEQFNNYKGRLKMYVKLKETFGKIDGVEIPKQMKQDIKRTYSLCRAWKQRIKKAGS
jgi:hypothetical protein